MDIDPVGGDVIHILKHAAPVLTEVHDSADIFGGGVDVSVGERLLAGGYRRGVGVMGRVIYLDGGAVGEVYLVYNARHRCHEVEIVFPLKALLNYLKVKQTEEAAAEAEAQSAGGLRLIAEGGVVELQFLERVTQILIIRAVGGVNAAEYHRIHLAVAGQRLRGGILDRRYRVAHACVADRLYRGGDVADLARGQLGAGLRLGRSHIARLDNGEFRARRHHSEGVAGLYLALLDPDIDDNALVAVIDRVEYQCAAGERVVRLGGGDIFNYPLKHLLDILTRFCRYPRRLGAVEAYNVLHLGGDSVGVGRGKVYFIDNGHYLKVVVEGEVGVRKGLSLNALRGVDYQHRALAGGKRAGDLVVEVNVTRGVDEVEHIFFAVLGGVVELHGVRLDGDASFTLKIHFIEQLRRHVTQSD